MLSTKCDELILITGLHMVEGENQLLQVSSYIVVHLVLVHTHREREI